MVAEKIKTLLPSDWPVTVGDLPAPNVEAVGIVEFDGYYNTQYFGMRSGTLIAQPLVKIVGRSASYPQGVYWMDQSKALLHKYSDEDILMITMVGTPTYLGRNDQKLHEFQVTFQVQLEE